MTALRVRRLISLGATLVLAAAAWHFLAPPALGGGTSYVFTDGVSMQPRFHSGDLALVRARRSYHVGEIVAYHNRMLGTIVLHRIVAIHGDRYVFKGDNNTFDDPQHPLRSQLVGALWLHVPHAQAYVSGLRSPVVVGIFVAGGLLLLLGGAATRRRRRRRGHAGRDGPPPQPSPAPTAFSGVVDGAARAAALAACALLAVSLVLVLVAYTRPTVARVTHSLAYRQEGAFSYSGRVRRSVAYPGGRVRSGEPVFLKLVHGLRVRFAYRLSSRSQPHLAGTISLVARLESSTGWSRTFPLARPRPFAGDEATVAGTLDVGALPKLLASLERTTTVHDEYRVTFAALVHAGGTLGGIPLEARFAPTLQLTVDQLELQPPEPSAAHASDPFLPSSSSSAARTQRAAATLSLHGIRVRVDTLRRDSLAGCAVAGALLILCGATLLLRGRRRGEAARIRARYGPWIVPVSRIPAADAGDVVYVADVDALAKLAERYDRPLLHEVGADGRDGYAVADDGVRYVYRPPEALAEPAAEPEAEAGPVTAQLWMDRLGLADDGEDAPPPPPPRRRAPFLGHHPGRAA